MVEVEVSDRRLDVEEHAAIERLSKDEPRELMGGEDRVTESEPPFVAQLPEEVRQRAADAAGHRLEVGPCQVREPARLTDDQAPQPEHLRPDDEAHVSTRQPTFRGSIASMGGVYMLPVTAETRAGANVAAGDEVDLDIELDTQPREVVIPADFASALAADPDASRSFESLSYSGKRRLVIPIEAAKAGDTRRRRIERTVAALHGGTP